MVVDEDFLKKLLSIRDQIEKFPSITFTPKDSNKSLFTMGDGSTMNVIGVPIKMVGDNPTVLNAGKNTKVNFVGGSIDINQAKTTMDELIGLAKLLQESPTDNSIKNKIVNLLMKVPKIIFNDYNEFVVWVCTECSIDTINLNFI